MRDEEMKLAEVTKLQRDYRKAEVEKVKWRNEKADELRRQQILLGKLTVDHDRLKQELSVASADEAAMSTGASRLRELQLQSEGYKAEIDAERNRVSQLDVEIKRLHSEIRDAQFANSDLKKNIKGANSFEKKIQTLENRVKKSLNDYNSQLTVNGKLRSEIDHLKKEREVFNKLQRKLGRELDDQKTIMTKVIATSNVAYEARTEALTKLQALQEKTEKEKESSAIEIKELKRVLDHDRKLRDFMSQKGRSRTKELEDAQTIRQRKDDSAVKPEQLLQEYDDVFEQIKEITGIADNSELVKTFIDTEDRNFALFNLVNEFNSTIENTIEAIDDIEANIRAYRQETDTVGSQRKKTLQVLEEKLDAEEIRSMALAEQQKQSAEQLSTLRQQITEVFETIGCDPTVFDRMLGDKEVSDTNLMQFLGVIEQRANELLQQQALINMRATRRWEEEAERLIQQNAMSANPIPDFDPANELPEKPQPPRGLLGAGPVAHAVGAIVAPTVAHNDDDDPDDDSDVRPLTLAELRATATRHV